MSKQVFPIIKSLYCKDDSIVLKSSSGGIFYPIAKHVIDKGGVVFGAGFNDDFDSVYKYTESTDGLIELMGSKYVECSLENNLNKVKSFLENNRLVLFSGTPCKVYGLKKFLGKDYENLITIDFICHGVPSRKVWRSYLEEISHGRDIKSVSFRDKTESWQSFSLKIDFEDGSIYRRNLREDIYLKGFLNNLYLRPSCHECAFKDNNYMSDMTIGDFWGAEQYYQGEQLKKGISLQILRTDKGLQLYDALADKYEFITDIPLEYVEKTNSALVKPVYIHKNRDIFFDHIKNTSIEYVIEQCIKKSLKEKVKIKFINILRKIKRIIKRIICVNKVGDY